MTATVTRDDLDLIFRLATDYLKQFGVFNPDATYLLRYGSKINGTSFAVLEQKNGTGLRQLSGSLPHLGKTKADAYAAFSMMVQTCRMIEAAQGRKERSA